MSTRRGNRIQLRAGVRDGARLGLLVRPQGQANHELAAMPEPRAAREDRPPVKVDEAPHHREPDAQSALSAVQGAPLLHEEVEDVRQGLWRDADPRVSHADQHLRALDRGRDGDLPPRLGVLRRVGQQIRDRLGEATPIGDHRHPLRGGRERQVLEPLFQQRARHLDRLDDDVSHLDALLPELDLPARDARNVEEIVHQADDVLDLARDDRPLLRERVASAEAHQNRSR